MLAFEGFTLVNRHAAIDAIGQKVIEITALEVDPASRPAIFALLYFGMAVVLGQYVDQFRNRACFEVKLHNVQDLLGFDLIDQQLSVDDVISQRNRPAHPDALLLRRRDLVADPLAGDLALELAVIYLTKQTVWLG